MRVLIACLVLVSADLPLAQVRVICAPVSGNRTSSDTPQRNEIGLTVEYGSDGLACEIVVERKQPLLHNNQAQQYMPTEVVSALIDEIMPLESRGRHINTLLESMGCAEGHVDEYENVWIGRYSDNCVPLKPERDSRATIAFKRPVCPVSPYAELHN